jgi:hypothetical protein
MAKRNTLKLGIMILALGLFSMSAEAQPPGGKKGRKALADGDGGGKGRGAARAEAMEERFAALDADGSGSLTEEELVAAARDKAKKHFANADADQDGQVTKEEWKEALKNRRGQRGQE